MYLRVWFVCVLVCVFQIKAFLSRRFQPNVAIVDQCFLVFKIMSSTVAFIANLSL